MKHRFTNRRKCMDINECMNPSVCDSNAECENLEGSYSCSCKTGYIGTGKHCEPLCGPLTCGPYKTCEISPDNKPECKCRVPPGLQDRLTGGMLFCATDGEEYTSFTQMINKYCPLDIQVHLDYPGPCKDSCDKITCHGGSNCTFNQLHGRPTCSCDMECDEEVFEPGNVTD